ncbi:MAG: tellurite resistance TerB family protein [Halomonas sp.]|nr:tellurite resistance TerB family protein [Halomonas sp.]
MNAKGILEELMKQAGSGASLVKKEGADVGKLLSSNAIGLLVGTRRGRKLSGKALKYGAIAGVGMMAWKAWQRRQASRPEGVAYEQAVEDEPPFERLQDDFAKERRSLAILKAMIAAACSDGHIDDVEREQLSEQIEAMGATPDLLEWAERQMLTPLSAAEAAQDADSAQAAREMYLASAAIVDDQNPTERAWLDQLAEALALDAEVVRELELQAAAVN